MARNIWLPLLFLIVASCTGIPEREVWTEGGQIHTKEGAYFVKGVCYHPVSIGKTERSFESLTQDLDLMQDMGINTIRVYEPIASEAVLDEIYEAGISVGARSTSGTRPCARPQPPFRLRTPTIRSRRRTESCPTRR